MGQLEKIVAEDLTHSRKVDLERWRSPFSWLTLFTIAYGFCGMLAIFDAMTFRGTRGTCISRQC